jgi:hypothetical protein
MMKPPTNREIPAKMRRNVSTKPSMPSMSARASSRIASPVSVSTAPGFATPVIAASMSATRSVGSVPSDANTEMVGTRPSPA